MPDTITLKLHVDAVRALLRWCPFTTVDNFTPEISEYERQVEIETALQLVEAEFSVDHTHRPLQFDRYYISTLATLTALGAAARASATKDKPARRKRSTRKPTGRKPGRPRKTRRLPIDDVLDAEAAAQLDDAAAEQVPA